jgi:hypothetical protein
MVVESYRYTGSLTYRDCNSAERILDMSLPLSVHLHGWREALGLASGRPHVGEG